MGDRADLARADGRPPNLPRQTEHRRLGRGGWFGNWPSGSQVMEQRAHAYATLVEDCERVVNEVGSAEFTLRARHGCDRLRPR
jgi:hypothetical protein